jgi:hypothetical protein
MRSNTVVLAGATGMLGARIGHHLLGGGKPGDLLPFDLRREADEEISSLGMEHLCGKAA